MSKPVRLQKKKAGAATKSPRRYLTRTFAEIDEKNIRWVVPPYLARGMITLLEGHGAAGKTPMSQEWAKAVADGTPFPTGYIPPDGHFTPKPGIVVCNDVENDFGSVNKKYFESIGAKNQHNIWPVEEDWSINDEKSFDDFCAELDEVRSEKGEIALIIFDTIATYTGGDLNSVDVAGPAMAQFKKLAEMYDCAVLLLRHWNKAVGDVRYRGSGHNIITNKARIQVSANNWTDEDHIDWYALRITKINVGIRFPTWGLLYSPKSLEPRNNIIERFRFEIDPTSVEMTLAEFSDGERRDSSEDDDDGYAKKRRSKRASAIDWLHGFCRTPQLRSKVMSAGEAAGHKKDAIERARNHFEKGGQFYTFSDNSKRERAPGRPSVKWFVFEQVGLEEAENFIDVRAASSLSSELLIAAEGQGIDGAYIKLAFNKRRNHRSLANGGTK